MDFRKVILSLLRSHQKDNPIDAELSGFTWEDSVFFRSCEVRIEHDDPQGWADFMDRLANDSRFDRVVRSFLEDQDITIESVTFVQSRLLRYEQGEIEVWEELVECLSQPYWLARPVDVLLSPGDVRSQDLEPLLDVIRSTSETAPAPSRTKRAKSRVMYIERKAGKLIGEARIGRVTFSKTGKTLYYKTKEFHSLKGRGFKSNFREIESGEEYWISGPRRDGQDRLYGERLPVHIDEDAREEYWTVIRKQPENVQRKVV